MLDEYDDGIDHSTFPECTNNVHPDDHWVLDPLCQAPTLVAHHLNKPEPPVCGIPADHWQHIDSADAAARRVGSEHMETPIDGRVRCDTCGWLDRPYDVDAYWHPESAEGWHTFVPPTEPLVWGENAWRHNVCPSYIGGRGYGEEYERPKQCSCRCHQGTYYVNVYALDQGYGGPEEGGWYYECGEPVASVPFDTLREAEAEQERLAKRFPTDTRFRYSVRPQGTDHGIYIERHFAAPFPEHTPRYE